MKRKHDNESGEVFAKNNHLYFYQDVNHNAYIELVKCLTGPLSKAKKIFVHIMSDGGDMDIGFAIYDLLSERECVGIAEGGVCSSAVLILFACKTRYMLPNAFLQPHELIITQDEFTYKQSCVDAINNKEIMTRLMSIYARKSKLNLTQIQTMLERDQRLYLQECVNIGFAQEKK